MLILGIHTAGQGCDIVLMKGPDVLAQHQNRDPWSQDVHLAPLTKRVWEESGIPPDQIDRISVVTGPGSFTGIRLGVAFARGLALALDKPCLGVTSLEASLPTGQQGSAMVLLPAQKRPPDITFWVQRFRSGNPTSGPEECGIDALKSELSARPHLLYGQGQALSDQMPDLIIHPTSPMAERAALFATHLDPTLHPPRPTYARAPDATLPA